MIEVIKHGNTTKEITCNNCEAVLRYEKSDVTTRYLMNAFGLVIGEESHINCPDCKSDIKIRANKWG